MNIHLDENALREMADYRKALDEFVAVLDGADDYDNKKSILFLMAIQLCSTINGKVRVQEIKEAARADTEDAS